MKLHLPVKLRASLLAAVVAVPALLYNMAYAGTTYTAPSNEYGWDTNDITLNQRYLQTSGNAYVADETTYTPYEMYGDSDPSSVNAKVRVGYLPTDTGYTSPLVYRNGQYGTVDGTGVFTPVADQSTVVYKATGPEQTNTASIIVQADTPTDGQYVSYMDGNGTFDSQEMVFTNSVQSGVNPQVGGAYVGNVNIDTDAIRVTGSNSQVVLEDVDIQDHDASGTTMAGAIEHGSQLVILDGNDNLTDEEKQLLNISGVANNNVYNNDTPRTVELGAVTGTSSQPGQAGGSLVVVGNKERTEAVTDEDGKITQGAFVDAATKDDHLNVIVTSVDNLSEFGAANADMDITGDVSQVVTLNLVNSTTEVGGNVGATGINVNGESTLQAVGDIKNINYQGASSTNIAGKVASSEGEISLTNGAITEGAIVAATDENKGDVTLSNIVAKEAERLEAGHDMTLTTNTTVTGVDNILIGNDLVLEHNSHLTDKEGDLVAPGDIVVDGGSSITDITGNVEAGDAITVNDGVISNITGNVEAGAGGISVTDGEISIIGGNVISGGDLALDNSDLTDIVGTVDVEGDMNVTNGSVVENLGGLDVEGGLTVDGSSVTDVANGADAVGELGDDLLVQNNGDVHNVTLAVDGDIIVDGSILGSSTLSATGKLEAKNGATLRKEEVEDAEGNLVQRDNVITVAQDSSILSGSQVSGTDLTVTSEAGDPSLEIKGTGTVVTADSNLTVDGTVTVDDAAELSLDGGEQLDASLSADNLVLGTLKDDKASISHGTVGVRVQTSVAAGDTLELADADGSLGAVVETGASAADAGTTLDIRDGSVIGAASIGTDATDAGKTGLAEYFDHVNVNGDSTLTVDGTAAIVDYNQGGADTQGSKTTIGGDAWLVDADITGAGTYNAAQGTETTINGNAHIGNLSMSNEGALSVVGEANDAKVGYIANLDQASDGHINVVNATLTTPELNGENISLGLNGGTVVLDQVAAADGATVASTAATNAHVLVGEITNASATGAPDQTPYGQSTIQTTVDRVVTEYSFSQGEAAAAPCKTYVFIAKQDGSVVVNGQTISFTAGQEVTIADTYLNTPTDFGTEGSVVTGVTSIDMDAFIAQNQDTLSPKLVAVVDADGNPVLDGQGNPLMAQVTQDSELTYYPEASQSLGSLQNVSDGIASLTVKNDFDADNTIINAYRTGTVDADGHVTADANTGFIDIQGVLSGQNNTLNADADVSINGIVSKEGADHQANNTVVSQQGDIVIGEEGIVGSGNNLEAEDGLIRVDGAINGNDNTLVASESITTTTITGNNTTLTAGSFIVTGDITGNGSDLDAGTTIDTGAITGSSNTLDAGEDITTGAIDGDSNRLTSTGGNITTETIEGNENVLDAYGNIETDAITGNRNQLDSETGFIVVDGAIIGDENTLSALDATNGSISTGAITGNTNDLDAGTTINTGDITGSSNTLDAVGNITTGAIKKDDTLGLEGRDNALTSSEGSISTGAIEGDSNDLTAYIDIETGAISGSENTLIAQTGQITVDGAISGSENILTAETSVKTGDISGNQNELTAGTSIEVGTISGDDNSLNAGTTITAAAVTGDRNGLMAQGDITVTGQVSGANNEITAVDGSVMINGTLDGSDHQVKAGQKIDISALAGKNQTVVSNGKGFSPDDVAIHVGDFSAQGASLSIATTSDPVMGIATGNGAIVIDKMSSVGDVDAALQNTITSNVSSVTISALEDFQAHTFISAHKDILVGSAAGLVQDTAANQTWKAENLVINSAQGLKLVNSTLTMTGSIMGGSLTLELDDSMRVSVSQAANVTLEALTLSNGAQLAVTGKADIESLTLVGKFSALNATTTEISNLTLRDGASYDTGLAIVKGLTISNSSMSVGTLADVTDLTLTDHAKLSITGSQGKTDLTEDLLVSGASTLLVTENLETEKAISSVEGSVIEARNITAGEGIYAGDGSMRATGGSITAGEGITADGGTLEARDEIIALNGSIAASNGSVITAGKGVKATQGLALSGASVVNGNVALSGGDANISDASKIEGNLALTDGALILSGTASTDAIITGSVTGATQAQLTNATVGNLVATGDVTLSNADTGSIRGSSLTSSNGSTVTGDVILTGGNANLSSTTVTGNIAGANDVNLTGSSAVQNIVNAAGNVDLTDSSAASISAAGNVDLTGSSATTISGADVTLDGGSTSGAITATGTATVTGSTVEGNVSATDVILTDAEVDNIIATGDVTLSNADSGSIFGATSVDMSAGSVVHGDVTMAENNTGVTMDSSTINGSIYGSSSLEIKNQSTVTGNVTLVGNGDLSIEDSTVHGTVSGAENITFTNTETGDVSVTGSVTLDNADTGSVQGSSLTSSNGSTVTGDVTLTGGDANLTDTTVTGSITGALNASIEGGSTGNVSAMGAVTLVSTSTGSIAGASLTASDSVINGGVGLTGGDATLDNTDVAGNLTGAANVTMTEGTVGSVEATGNVSLTDVTSTGTVTTDGSVTLNDAATGSVSGASLAAANGSTVAGDVTLAGGNATVVDSSVTGAITGAADVEITKGTAASVTATGDVALTDTTASVGSVTAGGALTLNNAQAGSLSGKSLAANAGSVIDGNVSLNGGAAVVEGASLVSGSITGAGAVTVSKSTTGDITGATGDVTLTDASVGTVETAGAVLASGTVTSAGSVSSKGLSVSEFSSMRVESDVTANGLIDLKGELTAAKGNINLTGTGASSIAADVTASKTVTLGGTIAAQESTISAQNIAVAGTLQAGVGTVLDGTVTGKGTISKTGGDELLLAADTDMTGGAVNVADQSTLKAEGGSLGALSVTDSSTLVVGGDSKVATELKADSLTMDGTSKLQSTLNLAAGQADKLTVTGEVDLKGATLVLDGTERSEEAAVADGTRHTVVGCTVLSGLEEDVEHTMETLNAHVENYGDHIDLVLSKNYKGAQKTWNQKQVADALAAINPEDVQGTEMGKVLDALAHTRSEADAVAALDSLGGAGLAAMQKVIAEESHEHMQTLRDTFTGLNRGIARRIAEDGSIIPGVNSNAVTASITGGTSNVSGDGNVGDYSRSSLGFMLAGAHAITDKWSFGGGFAYSSSTASCDSVDIDSDAFYFDVAMMYDSGRFHQMGTLGAGFYGFDTSRNAYVNASGHQYGANATGSTSATAINLSYEAAYDLIISKDGHHTFSPVVMAEATFAQIKGMTEGGAGNIGLRSECDDVQSVTFGGGARYTYSFGAQDNPGFVSAEALVVGTAGDDTMKVRNTFIANGSSFELNGPKAGGVGLRLNVGALVPLDEQWALIGNVTSEFRSDASAVSGSLGVKYSF